MDRSHGLRGVLKSGDSVTRVAFRSGDCRWQPSPVLAGLRAKGTMGCCLIVLVASGVVIGLGLTFWP